MEDILRSQEMDQINQFYNEAFCMDAPVLYFPVRHHSPACSFQLKKVIEEYKPDSILLEGPTDADSLITMLTDEQTKAPLAVYYSYKDSAGLINEEKKEYKCYYPFLEYSPELVALKEGNRRGVKTRFIDLPYHEILIYSTEGKGLLQKKEKNNYNDDYLLARNQYLFSLCEKQGMRNFDEFWEKNFEINGMYLPTKEFVKNVLAYCFLSRENTTREELIEDGCLIREQFMAEQLRHEMKTSKRILVVTGGFHTYGILKYMGEKDQKKVKLHGSSQQSYLMAYSMEATDRLNGYASGMPYPQFYQSVWDFIQEGTTKPYEESVLKNILSIGKRVRKKEGCLSTYDEICAYHMSKGLSALRGKKEPGAYELYDAVLTSFVKGDVNPSTDIPLRIFQEEMTGRKIGSLCKEASLPPLVSNFEYCCKMYGLKIHTSMQQEITLALFSTPKHRKVSSFLSQLLFLEVTFCQKTKGPSLSLKKNRNLMRERWNYKWNTGVVSELIDKSVYGATIEEASESFLKEKLSEPTVNAEAAARLLVQAFEMGLTDVFNQVMDKLRKILNEDSSFFSLVACLDYLKTAYEWKELYQMPVSKELYEMISACFEKAIILLPSMANLKEEDSDGAMKACKLLYQIVIDKELNAQGGYRERLTEAFWSLLSKEEINSKLEGTVLGLLYGLTQQGMEAIMEACTGYMKGTHNKLLETASFLRGLFYGAKDVVFVSDEFLRMVDELMKKVSDTEFMQIIPELRLAFCYFTPREIDKIAKKAASFYGVEKEILNESKGILPSVYLFGKQLDEYAVSLLGDGAVQQ